MAKTEILDTSDDKKQVESIVDSTQGQSTDSPGLSEKEKVRIIELERLKETARKEISDANSNRLKEFLNSPFGLWVLSTVVVGLVTLSYNEISQIKKEDAEATMRVFNLQRENNYRIQAVNDVIARYEKVLMKVEEGTPNDSLVSLENAYELTLSALESVASIKLMGAFNEPHGKYMESSTSLDMINITSRWRIGVAQLGLEGGYSQSQFSKSSLFENTVSIAILEGKVSETDSLAKTDKFEVLTRQLKSSIKITDSEESLFDSIYEEKTWQYDRFMKNKSGRSQFIDSVKNLMERTKKSWVAFSTYEF